MRVINGKLVVGSLMNESKSSAGRFYETLVYVDGSTSCNCKGWIYSGKAGATRGCCHTKEAERMNVRSAINLMDVSTESTLVGQLEASIAAIRGRKVEVSNA